MSKELVNREAIHQLAFELGGTEGGEYWLDANDLDKLIAAALDEVAPLNPPASANQCDGCRAGVPVQGGMHTMGKYGGYADKMMCTASRYQPVAFAGDERGHDTKGSRKALGAMNAKLRAKVGRLERELAALSASHSEQVREGWQLVPVEPTDAMLEAGDKYIGTPATYKSMLSACPSPAITKDFSQFLSAVMDAAGLIRHGRQSKELSEYLGMKCMEYRGAAPSAGSQKEQGE